MEDKRLDKIIEDKLGNFEIPYQAGSWDALANKLNTADATERFDDSMRRKLSDIELTYQPVYWDLLAQRLEQETIFRKQLIRYKATELLLVFLILVTFVQIFPNQTAKNIFPLLNKKEKLSNKLSTTSQLEEINIDTEIQNEQEFQNLSVVPSPVVEKIWTQKSVPQLVIIENNHKVLAPLVDHDLLAIPTQNRDRVAHIIMTNIASHQPSSKATKEIASLPIAFLEEKITTASDLKPIPFKHKKRFRIGMVASPNVDYVQTPYDEIFDKAPSSRLTLGGYSGGALASWEWKRWEIETGLIYSHKKYRPTDQRLAYYGNFTDGYKVEGLKDIELNTVRLPVNLRYDLAMGEKWHLYTSGGVSINIAVQANYDVANISASAISAYSSIVKGEKLELSDPQQETFNEKSTPSKAQSPALLQKKFTNGLLSGGSFKENTYYTANIGVGMERYLDERLSIFFQPSYHQHLIFLSKGIGPNEDRISTFNLLIGAKVGF